MLLVVTARELRYAGKTYLRGQRFEATDKDAKVLKLIRKANDAPVRNPVRKVAETRALTPEPPAKAPAPVEAPAVNPETPAPEVAAESPPATRTGRYPTRRLTAED